MAHSSNNFYIVKMYANIFLFVIGCEDLPKWKDRCPKWAETGECEDPGKKVFMEHYCRKSCKLPCKTGIIVTLSALL